MLHVAMKEICPQCEQLYASMVQAEALEKDSSREESDGREITEC
jgi:hypothetical protein